MVEPEYFDGPGLCTVCLADGSRKTLALKTLRALEPDEDEIYENGWSCYELSKFKIEGDYCIATLSTWGGFWGRVIVWDYIHDHVVHLTTAPFALCSTVFHGQVVSMHQVRYWFEIFHMNWREYTNCHAYEMNSPNGILWYSAVPLGVIDPEYEPDLYLLPLPVPDDADDDPNCFDIRTEGNTLVFRAGTVEYRLDSL